MGKRGGRGRRLRYFSLGAAALLVVGACIYLGISLVFGIGQPPVHRAASVAVQETVGRQTADDAALVEWSVREKGLQAAGEAEKRVARAKESTSDERVAKAKESASEEQAAVKPAQQRTVEAPAPALPPYTTMYLTIPKLGLYNVLVQDGTSEAVLSQGVGHVLGTGYPWVPWSNTYVAGHRLGYPGTPSDHVFWGLPSLSAGDEVILKDSLGQTYTYRVSEILEVPPTDLAVTAPVPGRDIVTLQTCIENYGDYWTPGPNWLARFIVRADRVA
jgi:sortase A